MSQWVLLCAILGVVLYWIYTSDTFNLTCIIAHKDGKTYCVRDTRNKQQSAELMAEVVVRLNQIVAYLKTEQGNDVRVQRLVKNYNPTRIVETLPTSKFTAYSEDKGKKLAFCLRREKDGVELIDLNTLTFVALHELGHLMTESIGHEKEFWSNFKYLLKHANELGIYDPVDYAKESETYCGMKITDNPFYDLK
jgi:hypothetical protein